MYRILLEYFPRDISRLIASFSVFTKEEEEILNRRKSRVLKSISNSKSPYRINRTNNWIEWLREKNIRGFVRAARFQWRMSIQLDEFIDLSLQHEADPDDGELHIAAIGLIVLHPRIRRTCNISFQQFTQFIRERAIEILEEL
jgi:hypothetical protein